MKQSSRDKDGRSLKPPASRELVANLSALARAMMRPHRTETTKGRAVKRKTASGYSYTYAMNRGANTVGLWRVDPKHVRELGSILMRIADGENAYRLFRQNERNKPSKRNDHQLGALAYWARFAQDPESPKNRRAAVDAFRRILPSLHDLSAATIKRIAGDHRELSLQLLAAAGDFVSFADGRISGPRREKIAALREYLAKKSKRNNVDE